MGNVPAIPPYPPLPGVGAALMSQNATVPSGYELCDQSQYVDLYMNFAEQLDEDVFGVGNCYA